MSWGVGFEPRAEKELRAADSATRKRIVRALDRLAADPRRASNVKPLEGGNYRLRVGDWRVIYALKDELLLVLVVKVGHRREVYRR